MNFSLAMSVGLVSMMLLRLRSESKGGISICLKTFRLTSLGFVL
jgi:hypothetical protein